MLDKQQKSGLYLRKIHLILFFGIDFPSWFCSSH